MARLRRLWHLVRSLPFRMRVIAGRERLERDMDEELRGHIERQFELNLAGGMTAQDARRAAALAFGSVQGVKEDCRDSWGVQLLDSLAQDVRVGARGLGRNRAYAAVVVLTLGLGIGANTAIFSVVNGVLLRPLPYAEAERVVALRQGLSRSAIEDLGFSVPELQDLRRLSRSVEALVEYHSMNFTLLGAGEPLRVRSAVVSSGFFDLLGVRPVLGRGFRAEDEAEGADPVLLMSHEYWMQEFGGDPALVGRSFRMNDRPHQVIGVLPPLPRYPDVNDVYMPASACPFRGRAAASGNRGARLLSVFGRLAPLATPESARQEMNVLLAGLAREYPDAYPAGDTPTTEVSRAAELMVRGARPTFLLLLATVGLVLLTACLNVANLALARLSERGKELAVRAALGAGRRRLLRQLATESTLLALGGGALGLLLAWATHGAVVQFAAQLTPRAADVRIDAPVLLFTLAISVLSGVLFGTLPGLPAAGALARAAGAEGGRLSGGQQRGRLRSTLVVAQIGLSFALVIGAALLLRSFSKLRAVDPGFQVENVITFPLDLNWSGVDARDGDADRQRLAAVYEVLDERVRALPGVASAGVGWTFPLNSGFRNDGSVLIEGRSPEGTLPVAEYIGASGGYFRALGVPLLAGRFFGDEERAPSSDSVIVNDVLARRLLPDGATGRRLSFDRGRSWRTVVGVVGDVRQASLDQEPRPTVFLPFARFPGYGSTLFVRTHGDPETLPARVRAAVHGTAPDTAVGAPRTLERIRDDSLASPRLTAVLLGLFAGLALTIAATGLSGVLAYAVSQRTREIGIRVVLGAAPADVRRMVMGDALRALALGLGLGLVAALGVSRLVARLLFGIEPTDPLCFAGSLAVLLVAGVAACLLPVRRAVSIQPATALRAQ